MTRTVRRIAARELTVKHLRNAARAANDTILHHEDLEAYVANALFSLHDYLHSNLKNRPTDTPRHVKNLRMLADKIEKLNAL